MKVNGNLKGKLPGANRLKMLCMQAGSVPQSL